MKTKKPSGEGQLVGARPLKTTIVVDDGKIYIDGKEFTVAKICRIVELLLKKRGLLP